MIRAIVTAVTLVLSVPAFAEVDVQEIESPGGIKAWLVEEHSIPFIALEISFKGGTSLDSPDKQGATYLMTGLLEEGAGELNSQQFAEARDDLAMSLEFDSWDDGLNISSRFLTETTDDAVALIHSVLVDPSFDDVAIDRVRSQVLSGIRSDAEDPQEIASAYADRELYGDHPYSRPGKGTTETVSALTRDDIVAAWQGAMARDRVYVSAVGDITADELETLLDKLFEGLPESGSPLPSSVSPAFDGEVHVIDYPTPQAVISFGQPGMDRDDPDFFAAYVMAQVLGAGGFDSRLMTEIREKRGLTYGVAAYLIDKDYATVFGGGMATANATVGESIELIRQEWQKMKDAGITQEELDRAKTYLTGAYPLRFDGNGRIANILVGMQMEGLTPDYISTRNDKVEAVTLEDVRRVADELLDPDTLSFIVVGQPKDQLN